MKDYIAANGTRFTDDDIERWAKEAENHFDSDSLEVTPTAPRAWEMKKEIARPHTIRITDSLWNLIEKDAKRKDISVADWIRLASVQALINA